ncbi:ArsI/CadI family heavy metal resistance metalloenzyme [Microbulbifer sp. TYP-18]|uniref:ArsI/CadI family heavy metal resistance metalloenzyme n=1 Tax=Microbulbifer sp. TYP-18 TaxID=3230024 RepID=UPI0034C6D509
MKRLHIHIGVEDISQSIEFYSALFNAKPVKVKPDYAKWMLDDPNINLAISTRVKKGIDHLGIQVDKESELESVRERIKEADISSFNEGETNCCYARSDKSWVIDPAGIPWEAYQTLKDIQYFSASSASESKACCNQALTA